MHINDMAGVGVTACDAAAELVSIEVKKDGITGINVQVSVERDVAGKFDHLAIILDSLDQVVCVIDFLD